MRDQIITWESYNGNIPPQDGDVVVMERSDFENGNYDDSLAILGWDEWNMFSENFTDPVHVLRNWGDEKPEQQFNGRVHVCWTKLLTGGVLDGIIIPAEHLQFPNIKSARYWAENAVNAGDWAFVDHTDKGETFRLIRFYDADVFDKRDALTDYYAWLQKLGLDYNG